MEIVRRVNEMKEISGQYVCSGRQVGFVPTMGYFHEGHLSLIRRSKQENDITVVSIFVNPTQFSEGEDFSKYPRDEGRDAEMAEEVGVDYLFIPSENDMYHSPYLTWVNVERITDRLCGSRRPGHFRGVATVVVKLFNIVKPARAYFGKKDFQQLKVIKQLVKDLDMDVEIVACPIVREPDGLAMSSRNTYLLPEQRKSALSLYRSLLIARDMFESGQRDPEVIKEEMAKFIMSHPYTRIDYIEIVDQDTFEPVDAVSEGDLVALAVFVGNARLIDNWVVGEKLQEV